MSFRSYNRGFTIIELVVSVGIMMALSTIIALNQSRYTSGAELKNIANNLGLSLREAQVYGISVKGVSVGSNNFSNFGVGYGLSFNTSGSGADSSYIFFSDKSSSGVMNGQYDSGWTCPSGGTSECLDKITMSTGNRISNLCVIDQSDIESCSTGKLDISFTRPAIEAKVYWNGSASGIKGARIELSSADGTKHHSVVVYTTGQISIQDE